MQMTCTCGLCFVVRRIPNAWRFPTPSCLSLSRLSSISLLSMPSPRTGSKRWIGGIPPTEDRQPNSQNQTWIRLRPQITAHTSTLCDCCEVQMRGSAHSGCGASGDGDRREQKSGKTISALRKPGKFRRIVGNFCAMLRSLSLSLSLSLSPMKTVYGVSRVRLCVFCWFASTAIPGDRWKNELVGVCERERGRMNGHRERHQRTA